MERGGRQSRGQATLFGFKRPSTGPAGGRQQAPPPSGGGGGRQQAEERRQQPPAKEASDPAVVTRETIEPLVIAPVQPRQGTPKLGRGKGANRFGFRPASVPLSNKVADSSPEVARAQAPKEKVERWAPADEESQQPLRLSNGADGQPGKKIGAESGGKVGRPGSHLPRPTLRTQTVDKWAKTAANNETANRAQTASTKSGDSPIQIQQLDHSPSMNKSRTGLQKPQRRQLEMVFNNNGKTSLRKTFELREPRAVSASPAERPSPPASAPLSGARSTSLVRERREAYTTAVGGGTQGFGRLAVNGFGRPTAIVDPSQVSAAFSSDEDDTTAFDDETTEEEKLSRDKVASEKDPYRRSLEGEDSAVGEEEWGTGEAMALDEEDPAASIEAIDKSPESMNPPLRSVLLTIEDPTFAALAAMSNSVGMLEDEASPEEPLDDLSCSPPSVEPLPPPPANLNPTLQPGSPTSAPGTPTHASNSLSSESTRERDFLIDDEIADQPGLVFNGQPPTPHRHHHHHQSTPAKSVLDSPKTIASLAGEVSRVLASVSGGPVSALAGVGGTGGGGSTGTLSPCESLASDDLMADFDRSDDASNFDDLNDLDETALKSELETQSGIVIKEWNSILSSHPGIT